MWNHKHDGRDRMWRAVELVFAFATMSWALWREAGRGQQPAAPRHSYLTQCERDDCPMGGFERHDRDDPNGGARFDRARRQGHID